MKIIHFWKKLDPEIFWFGFYGHLKVRKFRNFEDFWKLTIFKLFAKFTKYFFSKFFCFSMNFRTSFTSCQENWTVFRPKKCIFCETYIVGDEKIQKKLIFAIFFLNGQKRQWKAKMWWSFLFLFNFITQKVGKNPLKVFLLFQILRFRVF